MSSWWVSVVSWGLLSRGEVRRLVGSSVWESPARFRFNRLYGVAVL